MSQKLKDMLRNWVIPPGYINLFSSISQEAVKEGSSAEKMEILDRNKALLNRHSGQRCFILGAGSSIAKQELKKLAGEYVISVSNTFVHEDYALINPRYHVLPHLMHGHGRLRPKEQFVEWLKQMEEKTQNAEMFFHIGDKDLIEENKLFTGREIHWNEYIPWDGKCQAELDLSRVPSIWSVSELAVTVALYMDFEKIYVLGFDHDWFNGLFVYFYDHKTQHAMRPNEDQLEHVDAEFQMRRHADIFKKYKCLNQLKKNIYNANADPNHYMDVFPKVDYNSLFE